MAWNWLGKSRTVSWLYCTNAAKFLPEEADTRLPTRAHMTSHQTIKKAKYEGAICSDRLNTRHGNSGGRGAHSGVVMNVISQKR